MDRDIPLWTQFAVTKLAEIDSPYRERFHDKLELQFMPVENDDDALDRWAGEWPLVDRQPHKLRIPADGATKPKNNNGPVDYHPELVARFGTSWWNWIDQQTEACSFDFDFGHGGNGLTAEQIAEVDALAKRHPAVMSCTSRGGKGRHWVVWLRWPIKALTRGEHHRVCDAILAQLSADVGVDLGKYLCTYGQIQYVYDCNRAEDGFRLVKSASETLALPENWGALADAAREQKRFRHVTKAQQRALEAEFKISKVELDETHLDIIDNMTTAGFPAIVESHQGRSLLKLHTKGLEADYKANPRKGVFATNSPGNNPQQPNAFAFLKPDGGLAVRRYNSQTEAPCWHAGPSGILCLDYNISPTFEEACRQCGGKRDVRNDWTFSNGRAPEAMKALGIEFEVPQLLQNRLVVFRRDGQSLHVQISGDKSEKGWNIPGWRYHYGKWEHDLADCLPACQLPRYEHCIRFTTELGAGESWHYLDDQGRWIAESLGAVKTYLKGYRHNDYEIAEIVQHHLHRNWRLERIPFAGEYPSRGRTWNRDGARYACEPKPGDWTHWKMILDHCGRGLDRAVADNEWCRQHGILRGSDYLKMWAAVVFRKPTWRLPYLFLFSPEQGTGKSTFHRALARLFDAGRGCAELRKELTKDDFNDALVGAALCFIEEIDLSQSYSIYNLVKNYVDAPTLKIRGMYSKADAKINYTHWVHTANPRHYCPVYPGDTRIVVVRVERYEGQDLPWLTRLQGLIDQECPAFLDELLKLTLPAQGDGRLYLPVLETAEKREAIAEREAEMQDWYVQLRELAADGKVNKLTAGALLEYLKASSTDPRLPKSASGLSGQLKRLQQRLASDGFALTWTEPTKKAAAVYTIAELESRDAGPAATEAA